MSQHERAVDKGMDSREAYRKVIDIELHDGLIKALV